jgi:hypothetical protein
VRVRVVLCVALLVVAGALVLDMSGRAPRTAGSNHISPAVFSAAVPGGGLVCQPLNVLPDDAARVQLLIGTYGQPVPELRILFLGPGNAEVADGQLSAGGREGLVTIPLVHRRHPPAAQRACLRVGGSSRVVIGGEAGPVDPSAELVNGRQQPGRISLAYLRSGSESWWQLLPTLSQRFGRGKAAVFGDWTLPVAALLLLGVWAVAARLLIRELT